MANGLSTILLDKHHLTVGETVTLFCHGFTTSATDWIGLFYSGDVESMSNCLDYKQGGKTVEKRGLKWLIANTINFEEAENKCLFKYVNGASGSVKAVSQVIHIINTDLQGTTSPSGTLTNLFSGQLLEFTITGMEARDLKRTLFGRPSPYVKVSLRPGRMQRKAWRSHHGQIGKTSSRANTTEPSWRDEVFAFKASIWDILEIEVRNRHTGIRPTFSKFLGKLNFPLRELLSKGRNRTQTFHGQLMKREPSRKMLGTFSLTIKTDRDLPGSRNSRRQASPDSLESRNGELLNGTSEEHPESEEDRRPSLNASTPDDDLSFRGRTSTVPIPPARAMAQVYMDQSTAAQSQPDLLGLPYTTHENVLLRKRIINNSLGISPELSSDLRSRLSMPPFVFSSTSLRSFENSTSTSSSYANDMVLRADDNDEENMPQNSSEETEEASLNEQLVRTIDDEQVPSSGSVQINDSSTGTFSNTFDVAVAVQPSEEPESNPSSITEAEGNNFGAEGTSDSQGNLSNLDTIMCEEERSDNTSEIRDDGANLGSSSEQNLQIVTNGHETNVEVNVAETVFEAAVSDEGWNNENISEENEFEETSPAFTLVNTNTDVQDRTIELGLVASQELSFLLDNSVLDQEDSSGSIVSVHARANNLPVQDDEILTVELPSEEPTALRGVASTVVEEPGPINEVNGESYSANLQENINEETSINDQLSSATLNINSTLSVIETENPSNSTSNPNHSTTPNHTEQVSEASESFENTSSMFTRFAGDLTGNSFMDLESEPEIMNALSLSNAITSDIIMPTQSTDIEETSPRRTVGTCNLRTLFQIPDNGRNPETVSLGQSGENDAIGEEIGESNVSVNAACQGVTGSIESNDNNDNHSVLWSGDLDTHEGGGLDISSISNVSNVNSGESLLRGCHEPDNTHLLDITTVNDQHVVEQSSTEDISQSTESSDAPQSSTSDEPRTALASPVQSITRVRYLRSKNVSIRLPSRSSTPLPVVHVVPPNVPVSRNSIDGDLISSPIEAELVLPASRLDSPVSPVLSTREPCRSVRSLARDVFDAPDSSMEDVNVGASTSHSGSSASHSGASTSGASTSDIISRSSASAGSHSAAKHRSTSDSSQSGKHKKKSKLRNRASRHSSATERTETGETSGKAQSRRRVSEERADRNLDNTTEETNDDSSHRPASIYVQISDFASDEDALDEPLPPHWERAVDTYGRVYYIDHENRSTTWIRPSAASATETSLNEVNHHRQNLDRRYQSFRRTLSGRRRRRSYDEASNTSADITISTENQSSNGTLNDSANDSSTTVAATATARSSTDEPSPRATTSRSSETTSSRSSGDNRLLLNSSFVKFLTRPDLFSFLKNSGAAGQYYFSHPEVKNMVKRIKEDPRNYLRFMHDRSLVTFLNGFADTSQPLPRGWEQKTDQFGQKYFVDHNSRSTNFADPRLPVDAATARNRSRATLTTAYADPVRRPPPPGMQRATAAGSSSISQRNQEQRSERMTYNQQIVEFMRQPNIDDILAAKDSSYANNVALKVSVDKIRRDGQRALRLLSDNVDLVMLLSLLEDDIVSWVPELQQQKPAAPEKTSDKKRNTHNGHEEQGPSPRKNLKPAPYRRDFQAKVKSFHKNIIRKGLGQGPNKIQVLIRREHILEDSFDHLMKQNPKTLQNSKLEVKFSGEEGLDYGGPQREFFFLLSRQLFNPYYGLFEYSAQDTYTLHISAMSSFVDNAHDWYRFCGRIIALVIIHQHLLDAFFTRPFYKLLLKSSCDLRDVEALDALFHQSLAWIMESDITDVSLDLSFTVTEELGGQVNERELLPGGKDIRVTEDNKLGYVELMSNWRIDRGVSDQRKSILKGFYEIIDYDLVSMFDACELELLISGTADIDVNDWFSHTEYRSGFHPNHKVIRWFWQAVNSFDNEQRLRLLQFVTGTSSVPYEGFAALRGSTGLRKFCIERWGNHTMLPRAHTCFNRLDLPAYQSYNELLEKLTLAVEETSTFGIQ